MDKISIKKWNKRSTRWKLKTILSVCHDWSALIKDFFLENVYHNNQQKYFVMNWAVTMCTIDSFVISPKKEKKKENDAIRRTMSWSALQQSRNAVFFQKEVEMLCKWRNRITYSIFSPAFLVQSQNKNKNLWMVQLKLSWKRTVDFDRWPSTQNLNFWSLKEHA